MPLLASAAPALAVGQAIGRVGCFLVGDDYGRPTSLPWGVAFPQGLPPTFDRVHPTQLYEAGAEFLILLVLLASERRERSYPGRTFWLYMLLYAVSRFVIEFYRGDERGSVGIFSTSQFISLILAPLAVVMLVYLSRRLAPEPERASRAA
jgi:phosphatidylglycerol:prolipoprotein diacylglycerol transferase